MGCLSRPLMGPTWSTRRFPTAAISPSNRSKTEYPFMQVEEYGQRHGIAPERGSGVAAWGYDGSTASSTTA